jgi:hypothetical protein
MPAPEGEHLVAARHDPERLSEDRLVFFFFHDSHSVRDAEIENRGPLCSRRTRQRSKESAKAVKRRFSHSWIQIILRIRIVELMSDQ